MGAIADRVNETVVGIRARAALVPRVGVVLGSGLGAFADAMDDLVKIPYAELPHLPASKVVGHAGNMCLGRVRGVPTICMQGRVHFYEGHSLEACVQGVRAMAKLGVTAVLLTNAAGGVEPSWAAGDLMVIEDHLNLTGQTPLMGPNDAELGPRFPDMSRAYDPELRAMVAAVGRDAGIALRSGVYAWLTGPSYETPAEVRMARGLGAHAVGMSTVPEVIALRHMGVRAAALSCITNLAAGLVAGQTLSHAEVEETARAKRDALLTLLTGWVARAGGRMSDAHDLTLTDDRDLVFAAKAARANAHAPYSGYFVGAAVRTADGRVFAGCNVENASYGATICAERHAIGAMIAAGARTPVACAVVTQGPVPGSPCGMCRQVLAEFARDLPLLLVAATPEGDVTRVTSLAELLPDAFGAAFLTPISPP